MLLKYARKQRASIYHPATIDDLPFEVLREAFLYLGPEDLVSPSRVNRSWRPAAQDVLHAQLKIWREGPESLDLSSLMCGIQLSRIVFGYEAYSIKHFELQLRLVDPEYIPTIARILAPSLRTLDLSFEWVESGNCYAILAKFFSQCHGIRNIRLECFDFGVDPTSMPHSIKEGFYRICQLNIDMCRGDLQFFVENVPIANLQSFSSFYWSGGDKDIVSVAAIHYSSIKRLILKDAYQSSATLLKFVECCRYIEELSFRLGVVLMTSDIEAIASLPCLISLNIECHIADGAFDALSRCRGLKHLSLLRGSFDLTSILHAIGRNLVSLEYSSLTPILVNVDAIIDYCPNLHMLEIRWEVAEEEMNSAARDILKLKMLAKLKVNGVCIWGYRQ
jgi:hypothetical protein